MTAEQIAQAFHEAYVRLAPAFADVATVPAIPWSGISAPDRALMVAVVQDLTDSGVILFGTPPGSGPCFLCGAADDLMRTECGAACADAAACAERLADWQPTGLQQ